MLFGSLIRHTSNVHRHNCIALSSSEAVLENLPCSLAWHAYRTHRARTNAGGAKEEETGKVGPYGSGTCF